MDRTFRIVRPGGHYLRRPGLASPVEILIDRWGVPHVYAAARRDLFVAQGFNAARDRLFQIDLWRRRGLGLLSEVFGRRVRRTRPRRAAVPLPGRHARGVARVRLGHQARDAGASSRASTPSWSSAARTQSPLPPEFARSATCPPTGRPPTSRGSAATGSSTTSTGGRAGADAARPRARGGGPAPGTRARHRTSCAYPRDSTSSVIPDDVLRVYRLATAPSATGPQALRGRLDGSNNWVIAASRTATGRPLLANDPHRAVTLPALRYIAHLVRPRHRRHRRGRARAARHLHRPQRPDRLRAHDLPDRPGGPVRLPDQPRRPASTATAGAGSRWSASARRSRPRHR